jgi:eukaryotic-like serine/threonine-protein kinase
VGLFDSLKGLFGPKRQGLKVLQLKKISVTKRFELRNRTGQGSMSKCYNAYDRELGRTVCLKVLDKEKTAKFEDRFRLQGLRKPGEGEICMQIRHENCVQTYDAGTNSDSNGGEPVLVMEWIDGVGLNYLLETKNKQLDGNRINYLVQLCNALDYLHRNKFIHRDLCPRNIMIDKEGVVKLIDFGLTMPNTPDFTKPGNRTGSADYLAPEIIKRLKTDPRVDLFALGVTAFEMFCGGLPWERTMSAEETMRRHLNEPPRKAQELRPDLEADVVALLHKSIEKEPNDRFRSADEFKRALKNLSRDDY